MKGRNLLLLVVAAVGLVSLALVTSRSRRAPPAPPLSDKVLPGLDINAVEKIVVDGGSRTAIVARAESGWIVPARHGYPAKFGKVREVLIALSELKTGPLVRASDEQKKAMRITAPQGDGSGGTLVSLLGRDGKPLVTLLMGNTHESKPADAGPMGGGYPDGRYVSPDGGRTVFLVAEVLNDVPDNDSVWLDSDLLSVSGQDIREILITGAGRAEVRLSRSEPSEKIALHGVPDGMEADTSKLYGVESALSYLRFNDIADPSMDDAALGMTNSVAFRAETFKGELYTVTLGGKPEGSDERYVRVEAAVLPAGAAPGAGETNAAALKEADEKARARKEAEDRVAAVSKKVAGWTFTIPSYSAEAMTHTLAELTKEIEKPAAAGDADAGSAGGDRAPAGANEGVTVETGSDETSTTAQ
jgi:hypothetical protein